MIRVLFGAACALALSGCVSLSRSSSVEALPPDAAAHARITEIKLATAPGLKVSPQFEDTFRQHVQAKLDACAKGDRPVRLEAQVDRLDKSNAVMTAIVAGSSVLRGWWTSAPARKSATTRSAGPWWAAASLSW